MSIARNLFFIWISSSIAVKKTRGTVLCVFVILYIRSAARHATHAACQGGWTLPDVALPENRQVLPSARAISASQETQRIAPCVCPVLVGSSAADNPGSKSRSAGWADKGAILPRQPGKAGTQKRKFVHRALPAGSSMIVTPSIVSTLSVPFVITSTSVSYVTYTVSSRES